MAPNDKISKHEMGNQFMMDALKSTEGGGSHLIQDIPRLVDQLIEGATPYPDLSNSGLSVNSCMMLLTGFTLLVATSCIELHSSVHGW